jgi:hypothetical protein
MNASAPRADAFSVMWFFPRASTLGVLLVDCHEDTIGRIDGTWPLDGSGEPEFAIVRTGRFGETRLVPLKDARVVDGLLQVPFTRREVDDAPALELGRYLYEQVDRARAYYLMEIDIPLSRPRV